METIELYRKDGAWVAKHSNPQIPELFGTDTIPTSFTAQASYRTVVDTIQRLNPDCEVSATFRQV